MTTQPDIYTVEARRRLAAVERDPGLFENILKGHAVRHYSDALAATLRELNWQPPVDPDLAEARKIVAAVHDQPCFSQFVGSVLAGEKDDDTDMACAFAAIKRGRELQKGE